MDGSDHVLVGISDFAQESLGDVVYVEAPALGASFKIGERCGTIESVKTASDIFSPVSGEVVAVNELLGEQPELINESPQETWIFKVKITNPQEWDELMSDTQYIDTLPTG
jgi:glycine cleavage system H protein